jgi:hypothetical protein
MQSGWAGSGEPARRMGTHKQRCAAKSEEQPRAKVIARRGPLAGLRRGLTSSAIGAMSTA